MIRFVVAIGLLLSVTGARAQPTVLRMASLAPEGTSWAREFHAFARDVSAATAGAVHLKWYLGGIAGDEMQVLDRIRRGQLDGAAGMPFCSVIAPSLRVLRIIGLFQSHGEARYVLGQLRGTLDQELARSGFVSLGWMEGGTDVVFSRRPLGTFEALRHARLWVLDTDDVMKLVLPAMGFSDVPLPIGDAAAAYDRGKLDGFLAVPSIAIAWQWQTHTRYVSDLRVGGPTGCTVLATRAFDRLPAVQQQELLAASAKYEQRIGIVAVQQDEEVMSVVSRMGITTVPVSAETRRALLEAARKARSTLGVRLVPSAVLDRVMTLLADFRAEHRPIDGD